MTYGELAKETLWLGERSHLDAEDWTSGLNSPSAHRELWLLLKARHGPMVNLEVNAVVVVVKQIRNASAGFGLLWRETLK